MANIPVAPPDLQGLAGTLDVPATYVQALTPVAIAPPDLQGLAGTLSTPATSTHDMKGFWPSTSVTLTILTTITAIGAITGTAQVGQTLTAGALTPGGATATYQWQWCATSGGAYASIPGATSTTYVIDVAYVGDYIKVVATGSGSYTGTVTSAATALVNSPLISISAITGTPQVGQTLTAGAVVPAGATVTYQWIYRVSPATYVDIPGATSSTYIIDVAYIGTYIEVEAIGTGSYVGTVPSADTAIITAAYYGIAKRWNGSAWVKTKVQNCILSANLLAAENSSFEGGTVGAWVGSDSTLTNSTAEAFSGTHSLRQYANTSANALLDIKGVTSIGTQYTATVNFKMAPGLTVTLRLFGDTSGAVEAATESDGTWQSLTVSKTFAAGDTTTRILVLENEGSSGDLSYWDAISLSSIAWQTKKLMRWDGASWKEVDNTG
jgi:broad-specificity NMP kinase